MLAVLETTFSYTSHIFFPTKQTTPGLIRINFFVNGRTFNFISYVESSDCSAVGLSTRTVCSLISSCSSERQLEEGTYEAIAIFLGEEVILRRSDKP